jgi:integrase
MIEVKTRVSISKEDWVKLGSPKRIKDAKLKNQKIELDEKLNKLEKIVLTSYNKKTITTKDWLTTLLKNFYEPIAKRDIPETIIEYFPLYLDSIKNQIERKTLARYRTAYTFLQNYIEVTGDNPRIDEVDPNFLMAFEEFSYDQDYAVNTVNKYFSIIKSLCKHALMHNSIPISPKFDLIKLRAFRTPIVFLNLDELKKINAIKDSDLGERLANIRDWLIISCFTGQRISDFMKFKVQNIRSDYNGKVIDIIQQKGKKSVSIPLFEPVLKIMDKHNGKFPRTISDQKFNEYVKEVVYKAGITEIVEGGAVKIHEDGRKRKIFGKFPKYELITSHIGRRSFATNFYGKLPTPMIMNITGHVKESTFLTYCLKTTRDTATETANAYKKLNIQI